MKNKRILNAAVKAFGQDNRIDLCIEEMARLTVALLNYKICQDDECLREPKENMVREKIAGLRIVLNQMQVIFGDTAIQQQEQMICLNDLLIGAREPDHWTREDEA